MDRQAGVSAMARFLEDDPASGFHHPERDSGY
jgi:hypothetical protein